MENGETDIISKVQIIYHQNERMLFGDRSEHLETSFGEPEGRADSP